MEGSLSLPALPLPPAHLSASAPLPAQEGPELPQVFMPQLLPGKHGNSTRGKLVQRVDDEINDLLEQSRALRDKLAQRREAVLGEYVAADRQVSKQLNHLPGSLEKAKQLNRAGVPVGPVAAAKAIRKKPIPKHLRPEALAKLERRLLREAIQKEPTLELDTDKNLLDDSSDSDVDSMFGGTIPRHMRASRSTVGSPVIPASPPVSPDGDQRQHRSPAVAAPESSPAGASEAASPAIDSPAASPAATPAASPPAATPATAGEADDGASEDGASEGSPDGHHPEAEALSPEGGADAPEIDDPSAGLEMGAGSFFAQRSSSAGGDREGLTGSPTRTLDPMLSRFNARDELFQLLDMQRSQEATHRKLMVTLTDPIERAKAQKGFERAQKDLHQRTMELFAEYKPGQKMQPVGLTQPRGGGFGPAFNMPTTAQAWQDDGGSDAESVEENLLQQSQEGLHEALVASPEAAPPEAAPPQGPTSTPQPDSPAVDHAVGKEEEEAEKAAEEEEEEEEAAEDDAPEAQPVAAATASQVEAPPKRVGGRGSRRPPRRGGRGKRRSVGWRPRRSRADSADADSVETKRSGLRDTSPNKAMVTPATAHRYGYPKPLKKEVAESGKVLAEHLAYDRPMDEEGALVEVGLRDILAQHTEPVDYTYPELELQEYKSLKTKKYRIPGIKSGYKTTPAKLYPAKLQRGRGRGRGRGRWRGRGRGVRGAGAAPKPVAAEEAEAPPIEGAGTLDDAVAAHADVPPPADVAVAEASVMAVAGAPVQEAPLLVVDINITPTRAASIPLWEDQDAKEAAKAFLEAQDLNLAMLDTLATMLEEQRQDVLRTREEERVAAAEAAAAAQEALALAAAEAKAAAAVHPDVVSKKKPEALPPGTPVKDTATAAMLDFGDGELSLAGSDVEDGASLASDLSELEP